MAAEIGWNLACLKQAPYVVHTGRAHARDELEVLVPDELRVLEEAPSLVNRPVGSYRHRQQANTALCKWGARTSKRPKPLGMLADEARDPAPMPERSSGQEAAVDDRVVVVGDKGRGHVPALPACFRRPVAEVDVLSVEAVAGV